MKFRLLTYLPLLPLSASLITNASLTHASPEPPPAVTFSADRVEIVAGQAVTLAWSSTNAKSASLSFVGDVPISGSIVVKPLNTTTYTLRVRGDGGETLAVVTVTVSSLPGPPPYSPPSPPVPAPPPVARETGRAFLVGDQLEAGGYGLYSYLLFGTPPTDVTRERHLKTIEAYLAIPKIEELAPYIVRINLNITYLPIRTQVAAESSPRQVLDQYNYARARALLRLLPGSHLNGPYILSSLRPLSGMAVLSGQYLWEDLSFVPPNVVGEWVNEFLKQTAQQRFWNMTAVSKLTLDLRTAIAILAIGLPDVQNAVKSWIVSKD